MHDEIVNKYLDMLYGEIPETLQQSIQINKPISKQDFQMLIEAWLKHNQMIVILENGEYKTL